MGDIPNPEFLALQEALVGRYSLEREIGRGGMGVVYLAHEVALDRPVALKLLPPAYAVQSSLKERFLREARTAAKLSHPNIIPIHSVDEVDGFVFFAMAYIEGETLGERIRNRGPLPVAEAVTALQEVAWALAYAHSQGVVHRDVKPDNILLEKGSGRALVADFGIAQVGHEQGMTNVGEVLGTAEFMSPEQASGEEVDARSDIYALGAVGFYALSGHFPFEGPTVASLLAKHISQPAPPIASVAPEVPADIARAIDRCLRKEPDKRYVDGATLAEAIGKGVQVTREIPVPLRIFIKGIRETALSVPGIIVLWVLLPFALMAGWEGLASGEMPLWAIAALEAVYASILLSATIAPVTALHSHVQKLIGVGFGVEDVRLAMGQDVARRTEEIRVEYGKEVTGVDHAIRLLTWGSFSLSIASVVGLILTGNTDFVGISALALTVSAYSSIAGVARNKRRRDAIGDGWLTLLRSKVGKWLFKLGGIGMGKAALASAGAHRPTEMAIMIAADRLFESLPKSLQRELQGLPDAVRQLEADAQGMRQQVDELSGVLAEIGDDPGGVGADERDTLRKDLEATRDQAKNQMTEAVSALERIRLGLLRMHAGDGNVESLTMDLGAARDISVDIEGLLAGREDVERLLEKRRTTGRLRGVATDG